MTEDRLSKWKDTVSRVASFVATDFPDVEKEDLVQQLNLFLLEKKTLISPDVPGATTVLTKAARGYAWDQRKQHLQLSVQYSYRNSDVRAILETVFSYEDWKNVRVPDDAKSEFNDVFLELNTDVKRGWQQLKEADKRIIFEKFGLGIDPEDGAARQRLSRAIQRLTDKLNFYQPKQDSTEYVGSRRVINNATANFNINNLTDG